MQDWKIGNKKDSKNMRNRVYYVQKQIRNKRKAVHV